MRVAHNSPGEGIPVWSAFGWGLALRAVLLVGIGHCFVLIVWFLSDNLMPYVSESIVSENTSSETDMMVVVVVVEIAVVTIAAVVVKVVVRMFVVVNRLRFYEDRR